MKCSICEGEIEEKKNIRGEVFWDGGNNAQPVNNGRCCDTCDCFIVIPARMGISKEDAQSIGEALLSIRQIPPINWWEKMKELASRGEEE
tara:strand:- start:521 stop:790 length:270 start_codon:yes stop_codon:yes gene_type:complete